MYQAKKMQKMLPSQREREMKEEDWWLFTLFSGSSSPSGSTD